MEVRKLYLVKNHNVRLVPDTVFFSRDTLFFAEKGERLTSNPDLKDFRFEEVYYRFIVDKYKNFSIRDWYYTRHYLGK
jgi:hypothetical protein